MASVAMLLFWSVMSASMSMLQLVTAMGCVMATRLRVRTAVDQQTIRRHKSALVMAASGTTHRNSRVQGSAADKCQVRLSSLRTHLLLQPTVNPGGRRLRLTEHLVQANAPLQRQSGDFG
jgi:hypothetical protein